MITIEANNIGLISNAEININNLTVVAGENDSGKSTIGKIYYALIKSLHQIEKQYYEETLNRLYELVDNNYYNLRRLLNHEVRLKYLKELRIYNNILFNEEWSLNLRVIIKQYLILIEEVFSESRINIHNYQEDLFSKFSVDQDDFRLGNDEDLAIRLISRNIQRIRNIYDKLEHKNEHIYSASFLQKNLAFKLIAEFDDDIINVNSKDAEIIYKEDNIDMIKIKLQKNTIGETEIELDTFDILNYITDVTYIETPFIFDSINDIDKLHGHKKDLVTKLTNKKNDFKDSDILFQSSEITNGHIKIENDNILNISYMIDDHKINIKNTAQGIKNIEIIDILHKNKYLGRRHLLIIDEPEVHLHPEWQVEFAKKIVNLSKAGNPILVNTHSPYIVQALNIFSKNIELNTQFYLSQKNSTFSSELINCTENLDLIFKKLSAPLHQLLWKKH